MFVTDGWTGDIAGVRIAGESMMGQTKVKTRNSLIAFADPVISSGFRFQAERTLFGGLALLGITSPLKVEHPQLRYTSAVGSDLAPRTTIEQTSYLNPIGRPSCRELACQYVMIPEVARVSKTKKHYVRHITPN